VGFDRVAVLGRHGYHIQALCSDEVKGIIYVLKIKRWEEGLTLSASAATSCEVTTPNKMRTRQKGRAKVTALKRKIFPRSDMKLQRFRLRFFDSRL
jgi:hypothetical protein